eukprot:jgi/Chlat1/3562/Chrsp234S00257
MSNMARDMRIQTVVVIIAMDQEAAPIIKHLGLRRTIPDPFGDTVPADCYSGGYNGALVHIIVHGLDKKHGVSAVGTVPAAVFAHIAIDKFKPELLINAGTAGGFKAKGAAIGDVYISTALAYHDRRIPLPGFEEYGVCLTKSPEMPHLRAALPYKSGVVSSGNSFDCPPQDMEMIQKNDASVKDMEGNAVAWVADMASVPFFALKAVTDIVDGGKPTAEEFMENLGAAAAAIQKAVPEVLDYVIGKKFSEL